MAGEYVFDRAVSEGLLRIDQHSVLSMVDEGVEYRSAWIRPAGCGKEIWNTITVIWFQPYLGYADTVGKDQ